MSNKFKKMIRRVQRRLEEEVGEKPSYRWLLHLHETSQMEPTEDTLYRQAKATYRSSQDY